MPELECLQAAEFSLAEVAATLTRSFEGYFVAVAMGEAELLTHVRRDSVDLAESRIVVADGAVAGVALIARRGWSSRVAAMGVTPEWRGRGVGTFIMEELLHDARQRRDRQLVLEVIDRNEPAVRLYEAAGFRKVRRLVSLVRQEVSTPQAEEPDEIDIRELARLVAACGLLDLPWQLSAETVAQYAAPFKAYRLDGAYAMISDPALPDVRFYCLLVEPKARRQRRARKIIEAITACHAGRTWHVPAIFPEEIVGPFEAAGFQREALAQWQMETSIV